MLTEQRDEWSPDELIYIRYNPVYRRSGEHSRRRSILDRRRSLAV